MIVQRMTVKAKQDRTEELAALISSQVAATRQRGMFSNACRIYIADLGQPRNVVVVEWEWTDLAESLRFWDETSQLPPDPEFVSKWTELAEPGRVDEVWQVRTA